MDVSSVCFRYWGKADPGYPTEPKWHPLVYHSLDVVAVAAAFWACSPAIRRTFVIAFAASSEESLRAWILFFTALHDVGKLHALFQIKAPEALRAAWPGIDLDSIRKNQPYDHGCDGYAQADEEVAIWIGTTRRRAVAAFSDWLAVVAGHHGSICEPDPGKVIRGYATEEVKRQDAEARRTWAEQAAELFLTPQGLSLADAPPKLYRSACKLLAGFCSLCDWIGSNTDLFNYKERELSPAEYLSCAKAHLARRDALRHFGLTAPALPFQGVPALLKDDEKPRGIQTIIDQLPATNSLTIVEAPTGSGKTEAALAHAWRLLEAGVADSVVFALPTQATANAMLARAGRFAEQAYGSANIVLAHGNRDLHDEFQRLVDAAKRTTAQKDEEAGVQCSAWLACSRKRVFLGQIGVCTVDQVLLSVLPVRHSFVRGFGLSRSVLIVDEVHAYDAYMNGLLVEVLRRQKTTGGSAILLSATLPESVRRTLLGSWQCEGPNDAPYPVLWKAAQGDAIPISVPESAMPEARQVDVELCKVDGALPDEALRARVIASAKTGALVGIVMNLVDDAQRLARQLREEAGEIPVDLFHARFRLSDRQEIEREVIARYGRESDRGSGSILVATQVIEQSLDLDFDWLLTQLCPVDLLFQRLGRLHRHYRESRPPSHKEPACTVLCPEGDEYGLHGLIYGDSRLLWRTEQMLSRTGRIPFPSAYRDWLEQVYADEPWEDEPEKIIGAHMAWRDDCRLASNRAKQLTTMTVVQFRDDDERATSLTRDGEMSLSVLPMLPNRKLLDGTRVGSIQERDRPEALLLNTVPAPAGWNEWLRNCRVDDEIYDGRYLIEMEQRDEDWTNSDLKLRYSISYGLEKIDEST